jgi:hypothetical protein
VIKTDHERPAEDVSKMKLTTSNKVDHFPRIREMDTPSMESDVRHVTDFKGRKYANES